ncbi:MAG: AraC family transcriptional regulator [Eubacteriales bacterium]|nr:AraC family transcriptional regulator [Eubacteriales bacterium]
MIRNYLQYGKENELMQLLEKIYWDNLSANVDEKEMKKLYATLLRVGEIVINRKKILPTDIMGEQYISWDEQMAVMRPDDMYAYLTLFYRKVAEKMSVNTERSHVIIEQIVQHLNENFSQDLCLSNVSEKYDISVSSLTRLCKEYTGETFQNYLTHIRIKHACELLKNTNATIDMISEQCGYASKFTFLRAYKRIVGLTPTEFRHRKE